FERRTRLDLFRILAIAAIPGLSVAFHFFLPKDLINLGDCVFADYPPQSNRFDILGGDHYGHPFGTENTEHIKSPLCSRNDPDLDVLDDGDTMSRVNDLFTLLKRQIHVPLAGNVFSSG